MKKNITIYTDSEIWDKFTSDCRDNGRVIGYELKVMIEKFLAEKGGDNEN